MNKLSMIRKRSVFLTLAAAVAILPIDRATAQLVASEAFDMQADQELGGTSGPTSTGWEGNWFNFNGVASGDVVSGSLARPVGTESFFPEPTGNSVFLSGLRGNRRQSVGTLSSSAGSLAVSFLARPFVGFASGFVINFTVTSNCCGGGTDISFGNMPNSATENNGRWAISNGITPMDTGNSFTDEVDAVVFELTYNVAGDNDLLRVWFDADPNTQPPTFSTQGANFGVASDRFIVGFNSSNNFGGSTLAFDELRVGRTLADVTIPEPGATSLVLLGLASLGSLRNRRRQTRVS